MLPGLQERLKKEISQLAAPNTSVKVPTTTKTEIYFNIFIFFSSRSLRRPIANIQCGAAVQYWRHCTRLKTCGCLALNTTRWERSSCIANAFKFRVFKIAFCLFWLWWFEFG